jgi:hypothetical protein
MIECPRCGRKNTDAQAKICAYCGELLVNIATTSTRALGDTDFEEGVPRWGTARFNSRMNLVLGVRGSNDELVFDAQKITELVIGRKDPATGDTPAVDLEPFGAIEQGVSRRHAEIIRKDSGSLQIVDRGSPNGTFLNGQRLIANQPRILRDGDELRLGRLVLLVKFHRE